MTINNIPYALYTQLYRIRETITSLLSNETMVKDRLDSQEKHIQSDNNNHANEILWGWEQLLKEINTLPDNCIDKSLYIGKAQQGLDRATQLLSKMRDQYFDEQKPYFGNLSIGGGFRWLE
jgi:hypothetical protein